MKVLLIDSNLDRDCWGASDLVRLLRTTRGLEIHVRRGPQMDYPAFPTFDRIVLSGSRAPILERTDWTDEMDRFIRRGVETGTPILGVCYGHQAIVRALLGYSSVRRTETPEVGWTEIRKTKPSPLLTGVSDSFYSFSHHFDEVWNLSPDFISFAESDHCEIQAFQLNSKPVFGIQFHPEKTAEEVKSSFSKKNFVNSKNTVKFSDETVGQKIVKNFLQGTME